MPSAAVQFVSASLAACGAVSITNPFDVVKTKRQLLNELQNSASILANSTHPLPTITLTKLWKHEGLAGLQRGLFAAYIYQIIMNGTRFMVFEPLRMHLHAQTTNAAPSLFTNALAGSIAGFIAAAVGTPFNLVKTRLQSFSSSSLIPVTGHQHGYRGVWDALWRIPFEGETISTINQRNILAGIRKMYHGVGAAMARTAIGSGVQLSIYEYSKGGLLRLTRPGEGQKPMDLIRVHFAAGLISGIFACLAMNPFDVVMTRLFNQKHIHQSTTTTECIRTAGVVKGSHPTGSLYSGLLDCFGKTVRAEGWTALMKGFWPHYVRIGPHTVLTLLLLEQIRPIVERSLC